MKVLCGELEKLGCEWNEKLGKISGNEQANLLEDLTASSKNGLENRKKLLSENLRRKNGKRK